MNESSSELRSTQLTESEWRDLRQLVQDAAGIKLSDAKRIFLASRLQKRLRATRAETFREYFDLVMRSGCDSDEYQRLINAVTTNKTNFFREAAHFDVLTEWFTDASVKIQEARQRGLKIWCAAASTGEEPYTIAAVLRSQLTQSEWSRVHIVASDIDTSVLEAAQRGVYDESSVAEVEPRWRMNMFVQGRDKFAGKFRVRRDLREHVSFVQENLVADEWNMSGRFDAVFCRNVLIYFHRTTQERVVRRLLEYVEPHGLLFLGAAESINGLHVSVRSVAHSVYVKSGISGEPRCRPSRRLEHGRVRRLESGTPPRDERQKIGPGEARFQSAGWLLSMLEESCVVVIHDVETKESLVTHVACDSESAIDVAVSGALAQWHAHRPAHMRRTALAAKILRATDRAGNRHWQGVHLERLLSCAGARLLASRCYANGTCAWIEPSAGRVFVAATAPTRNRHTERGAPPPPPPWR